MRRALALVLPLAAACTQRVGDRCDEDDDCHDDESCSDTPEGRVCLVRDFLKRPHGEPGTQALDPR